MGNFTAIENGEFFDLQLQVGNNAYLRQADSLIVMTLEGAAELVRELGAAIERTAQQGEASHD